MPISIYRKKIIEQEEKKAYALHKAGFTYREIGEKMEPKKSHTWVGKAVNKQTLLESNIRVAKS